MLAVAIPQPTLVPMPILGTIQDPITKMLQEFDLATRRDTPLQVSRNRDGMRGVRTDMTVDEWLEFIDFLVYYANGNWLGDQRIEELSVVLARAGSEWTVGEHDGGRGLVKRVPEGVAVAARTVIESSTSAGALLGEAWHAVFGRNPDPEEAYEKAIKAVEEAGAGVVAPKNGRATLGTMVRDMKAQSDWSLPLDTEESGAPVRMAEALWQGQESRHGGSGYRKPTPEEAESAVLLAVPLVEWFASGLLARR